MGGCKTCGGKKNSGAKYKYTSPKGETTTYKTEIEAKAAKIRSGGGQITQVSG